MSITHAEARRLIQFNADDGLRGTDINVLEAHLSTCVECQQYAASIQELEVTLPQLLHRRWNQRPLPHPAGKVVSRRPIQLQQNIFFATRIIAMAVIGIAFLFNVWQFTQTGKPKSSPPSADIPMIPTPSAQSTVTELQDQKCETILYEVQHNDTLENIAKRFSVTADEIQKANQLRTSTLTRAMKLSIPRCSLTPSGTPNTIATTYTPLLGTTTLTPVNSPTQ